MEKDERNVSLKTVKEIYDEVSEELNNNHGIRKGQALYKITSKYYPGFTTAITSTMYDPFYDDEKVEDFISELEDFILYLDSYKDSGMSYDEA
jgi:predicted nucleotide-binding protein (sugar kinase/HSP70/actin superfamily)